MKLVEIHDDEALIISLIHQRMGKGETVFLWDDEHMTEAERIDSVKGKANLWTFRSHNPNVGSRDIIYSDSDLEKMQMMKRSASTWQVVVDNEAD
jgi:hypothetical protein